jgi:hypothetical protein
MQRASEGEAGTGSEAKEQMPPRSDGELIRGETSAETVVVFYKPVRERDRQHLKFVTLSRA